MRSLFLKSYEQEATWFVDKTEFGETCRRNLRERVKQIVNRFRVQRYNGKKIVGKKVGLKTNNQTNSLTDRML